MRIDLINRMKKIQQQERMRTRRNKVFFFLCLAGVAYLAIVVSLFALQRNDSVISTQEAVARYESNVTKQATESPLLKTSAKPMKVPAKEPAISLHRSGGKIKHAAAPAANTASAPEHSWRSTSGSGLTVHTTSSATVKSIGGGGGSAGGGGGRGSVTSSSSAFGGSTSIMVVPTLARASSHNLNASTTMAAEAQVIESTAQDRAAKPGIRTTNGYPDIPFPDPIGDGLWVLLVLAAAYAAFTLYRRKQRV